MYEETYFECRKCGKSWDMSECERLKLEKNKCGVCAKKSLCTKCYNEKKYKRQCLLCFKNIEYKKATKYNKKFAKYNYKKDYRDKEVTHDFDYVALANFYSEN